MKFERRTAGLEEAKFSTQKTVTYILLLIFSAVVVAVMTGVDQSERSMILQTVINLTLLAVGYWLGASKQAADSNETIGKMAGVNGQPVVTAAPMNTETGNVPAAEVQQPKEDK